MKTSHSSDNQLVKLPTNSTPLPPGTPDAGNGVTKDEGLEYSGRLVMPEGSIPSAAPSQHNAVLVRACRMVLDEVGNDYMACKDELRLALGTCTAPSEAWDVGRVTELLETLARYPVAAAYPDGPCIEREDMEEIRAILLHNDLNG